MPATNSSADRYRITSVQDLLRFLLICFIWLACIVLAIFFIYRSIINYPETYKVPEFNVTGAQLNRLNYTETNHTLSYNLALNITLTNPNKKIFFKLTDTQVIAYHQNKRFGLVTLMDRQTLFDQNPKSSSDFNNAVIQGWKPMMFEEPMLPNADLYNIDVVIAFREKGGGLSGQVICNLKLPLSFNGTAWNCYKTTKCSKVFYYWGS
ncbi:hypothetical protein L3X38_031394 [Prunus dulcis]|uniref:Late embryogenesis abundant protein LEA-2 subgroup domain-containing protein n=1 Tax=Prunus dulcis TaxID=3755 RepID=A0AAD4VEB1_PRUDU|nr:hypothetical protein L3X38_031394 [Prunus dulcis]